MSKIADFLQCRTNCNYKNEMTLLAKADSKHHLTKSYFDNYPLMTIKSLDYLCFIQELGHLGKRLTYQKVINVQKIKNSMNKNRSYFNWNHLQKIQKKRL